MHRQLISGRLLSDLLKAARRIFRILEIWISKKRRSYIFIPAVRRSSHMLHKLTQGSPLLRSGNECAFAESEKYVLVLRLR